jgi:hypothetical protein
MTEVQNVLRLASTIACAIVIAAFGMWASDEGRAGSQQQVARLSEEGPGPAQPVAPTSPEHDGVRGVIEDANHALLTPFEHVGRDSGPWPAHIIPMLLALLTYGLLGRILIAYLPR